MTSLDPFALLISSAPVLSCQQDHETHMDGDPPYVRLTFLIASSIFSYAGLRYGEKIEANWSHKIFANRRLPANERLFGNLHLTI